ncbi:hypothetical protein [Streptomyces sp. NPDC048436]|uniref:hypothetical protein n=1 Tax=Streptomyces sp. NPDC048436 TaxID=3365550 RepID=UPI003710A903
MPASILEEADGLIEVDAPCRAATPFAAITLPSCPSCRTCPSCLICPSCGSSHVAQVLGDNGGVSYVCTACGHSWS